MNIKKTTFKDAQKIAQRCAIEKFQEMSFSFEKLKGTMDSYVHGERDLAMMIYKPENITSDAKIFLTTVANIENGSCKTEFDSKVWGDISDS